MLNREKLLDWTHPKALKDLPPADLKSAINRETNPQNLIDFVGSSDCWEANEYYRKLTEGQPLVRKEIPGVESPGQVVLLPIGVPVETYLDEWSIRVNLWVHMKKEAIDRLLAIDDEKATLLLEKSCGYEVTLYLREKLLARRPEYAEFVRKEVENLENSSYVRSAGRQYCSQSKELLSPVKGGYN